MISDKENFKLKKLTTILLIHSLKCIRKGSTKAEKNIFLLTTM